MKKPFVFCRSHGATAAVALLALFPGIAAAEGFGVSAHASTLGLGLDLYKELRPGFNARLGFDNFNYKRSLTESDINYDAELKWQNVHLLADWYPTGGVFRATIGLISNNNKLTLTANPTTTINIGGQDYEPNQVGTLTAQVDFKKTAPYIGIGWGNPVASGKRWGFVADLGLLYQGAPKPSLSVTCASALSPSECTTLQTGIQPYLQTEEEQMRSDMNSFKWYPVATIGVSYQF